VVGGEGADACLFQGPGLIYLKVPLLSDMIPTVSVVIVRRWKPAPWLDDPLLIPSRGSRGHTSVVSCQASYAMDTRGIFSGAKAPQA
jgi:hypothetical protein